MSAGWDWAEPIRQKHFGEPLAGRYPLERLDDAEAYWALHDAELRRHFPPEVFFNLAALSGEDGKRARARLTASEGGHRLADFWVARDGERVVAMFAGHQKDAETYRMWHSIVHPDHRKRGLYGEIVRRVLAYTRELGFDYVVSEHAPSNNAVLIAKLKAGFRIVALELDAAVGPGLNLRYFHNEAHLRAYEFRCGLARLDERLVGAGFGAMPLLLEQLQRGTAAGAQAPEAPPPSGRPAE
ncbi:GNAT family N-acetyltransferase [Sorangium sp. So ce1078]|uniref:GNAT family N-acetyltransferase n=1 Tax=Sorangium sp. So ce1078 TaxID=3133329 RepID=UPI003F62FCED